MKIEDYLKNSLTAIVEENKNKTFPCDGFTEFLLDQSDGNFDLQYLDRVCSIIYVQPLDQPPHKSVCLYGSNVMNFDPGILRTPMQIMIPHFLFEQDDFKDLLDASQWELGNDFFDRLKVGESVRDKFKNFVLKVK